MIWALVDFSNLAHRALHSMQGLEFDDVPTGIIFGFFTQLHSVCFDPRIQSNRVALFFDSRQSYRRRAYPEYKEKKYAKEPTEEERRILRTFVEQMDLLREEVLPSIGFPCYRQTGLESDDLMAYVAGLCDDGLMDPPGLQAVIVTADKDLYQCVSPYVHWYDIQRSHYVDLQTMKEEVGLNPVQWVEYKALAGCSSDNVKGIPGIGEKTATKYLQGGLDPRCSKYLAITSKEGRAIHDRNIGLVHLPHPKTKPVVLREPQYDFAMFEKWCKRFGLKSMLEGARRREWECLFNGRMDPTKPQTRRRRD